MNPLELHEDPLKHLAKRIQHIEFLIERIQESILSIICMFKEQHEAIDKIKEDSI